MKPTELYLGGSLWALPDGERIRLRSGPPDAPHFVWLDIVAFNVIQAVVKDMKEGAQP